MSTTATETKPYVAKKWLNVTSAKAMSERNRTRGGFDYIINSMFLVAVVGLCIKIFFTAKISPDGKSGPANAVIYGYGIVALAILTVVFISYGVHDRIGKIENKEKMASILVFLKSFLTSSAPSILTIIALVWIISLNITYYSKINKGMVAAEYFQLSTGTSYVFLFQVICLFQYLKLFIQIKTKTATDPDAEKTQDRIAFTTYFATILNFIVIGIMTIILQFFSTDG